MPLEEIIYTNIKKELIRQNAVLVAHYYVDGRLQDLAEETGGRVSDSLEMARFGFNSKADKIIVAGVYFMAETAKILSPKKKIYILDKKATCSLDISCPIDKFKKFCKKYPDREILVYANTSAEIKANADWVVTSSSAVKVVQHLQKQNKKILWAPDKHLGNYIKNKTNADMVIWNGACNVHESFKAKSLANLKKQMPDACVLAHPESPLDVIELADFVGSTTQIIHTAMQSKAKRIIVATDNGILHKMKQLSPDKIFYEAPSMGKSAECESCAHCEWMAMNTLEKCLDTLKTGKNEIFLDKNIIAKAKTSIVKLLDFTKI